MVEQETHKLLVGGSSPPLDTISLTFADPYAGSAFFVPVVRQAFVFLANQSLLKVEFGRPGAWGGLSFSRKLDRAIDRILGCRPHECGHSICVQTG